MKTLSLNLTSYCMEKMKISLLLICLSFIFFTSHAQSETDTIHLNKVYYFGGTGLAFPLGKSDQMLGTQLFSGTMGLDISLKDSRYYLYPSLYVLSFRYDQLQEDISFSHKIRSGNFTMYAVNFAGGIRKQLKRLNTYVYLGPNVNLLNEPRAYLEGEYIHMTKDRKIGFGFKSGLGADYKFPGFFIGLEVGYISTFSKVQGARVQAMTLMVGLKSDLTKLSDKVIKVLGSEESVLNIF